MGPTKEMCGSSLMAYSNNYVDYPDCNKQQEKGNYIRQAWPVYITQTPAFVDNLYLRGLEQNIYIVMDAHNKQQ